MDTIMDTMIQMILENGFIVIAMIIVMIIVIMMNIMMMLRKIQGILMLEVHLFMLLVIYYSLLVY